MCGIFVPEKSSSIVFEARHWAGNVRLRYPERRLLERAVVPAGCPGRPGLTLDSHHLSIARYRRRLARRASARQRLNPDYIRWVDSYVAVLHSPLCTRTRAKPNTGGYCLSYWRAYADWLRQMARHTNEDDRYKLLAIADRFDTRANSDGGDGSMRLTRRNLANLLVAPPRTSFAVAPRSGGRTGSW